MAHVSIKGLRKRDVFAALYNAGRASSADLAAAAAMLGACMRGPMDSQDAAYIIAEAGLTFDYFRGVALKVDLTHDDVWTEGYDSRHGPGAFAEVIQHLRQTGDVDVPRFKDRKKSEV